MVLHTSTNLTTKFSNVVYARDLLGPWHCFAEGRPAVACLLQVTYPLQLTIRWVKVKASCEGALILVRETDSFVLSRYELCTNLNATS